jgi:hypothetical protein
MGLGKLANSLRFILLSAVALALAGCGGTNVFSADAGWFSRPMDFGKPDWNLFSNTKPEMNESKPVGPEDLVAADGTCAPAPEPEAPKPAATDAPKDANGSGGVADAPPPPDRLEPAGPAGNRPTFGAFPAGGVALGMTECQVVRRAGQPQTVTIGADASGERTAVVTYVAGNWPGVYHFRAGRLKVIDQLPQAESDKAQKTKKPKRKTRTPAKTAGAGNRFYVQ